MIPADCRSCGHHKPGSYYLPWAQGWVAQRIDSEEQSLLHICQLKSCPRQRGSNMHPGVFPAVAVLYPGAPAAGKHFLLHLPHLVPACSASQGVGKEGYTALSFIRPKGQLRHGFGSLSPKVLPPLCFAGSMAGMLLSPALMHPDRCRSPEISEWGIYRMRFATSDLQKPSAARPQPYTPFCSPQHGSSARAHRAGRERGLQGNDRFWGKGGHFSRSTRKRPSQSCPCSGREQALKISLLFLCPAWRIEGTVTKAPPAQAHASNSHARGSSQLSDVLALAVNTEILVLPQARVSLLPQAFAFSSFIAVPFLLGSNEALRL